MYKLEDVTDGVSELLKADIHVLVINSVFDMLDGPAGT